MFKMQYNISMSSINSSSFSNIMDIGDCFKNLSSVWVWTVLAIISFLLGFPASLMVLRELLQRQRLSNDFFMFNLTTTDTIFIAAIPFSILIGKMRVSVSFEWIYILMDGLSLCGRPLFMACICADCYFAVIHPILYMTNRKSTSIRRLTSVIVWVTTICFILLKSTVVWEFIHILNAAPLFIALLVITFCDISVLQALKKTNPSRNSNIHPQKKQAFHTIINSFIMTFIAYLPSVISFLLAGPTHGSLKC